MAYTRGGGYVFLTRSGHLCEPLGRTEGLVETVGWVLRRRQKVCGEEQALMSAGSEFQTEGAATPKPREANVVWTRGTDSRLVLEERNNNNNNNNNI